MVRMSDILKKAREKKDKEHARSPEPAEEQPVRPRGPFSHKPPAETPIEKPRKSSHHEEARPKEELPEAPRSGQVRISAVVLKDFKSASAEEIKKVYDDMVSMATEIMKKKEAKSVNMKRISGLVEKVIDLLKIDNQVILGLAFDNISILEDYLPPHMVSVSIYAIKIGMHLGYGKEDLLNLGIAAFLHDIGMSRYTDLAYQNRKLTPEEFNKIKEHPTIGARTLENVVNLDKKLIEAVYEEHERNDGSGYPRNLRSELINEYAKIIGAVDVYTAMIHKRTYRASHLPITAIQEILQEKNKFETKILKILIEYIGIYPVGSHVELNTKEIAQVLKVNHQYPLRPVVKIIRTSEGETPKEEKVMDLSVKRNVFTMKCAAIERVAEAKEIV